MEGKERREKILTQLQNSDQPLSGSKLASLFQVSRQVIVNDIALLRANENNIISTNKGYLILNEKKPLKSRTIYVMHSDEEIADELNTIVDCGGRVTTVMVDHDLYGKVSAPLIINNRNDVHNFVEKVKQTNAVPLKHLAHDKHYHTIEAENEEILDLIEKELDKKGYLIKAKE